MSLKAIVGKVKLKQLERKIRPHEVAFPQALQQPGRVLVLLPQGLRELTAVKEFLPKVSEMFAKSQISILSTPGLRISDMIPRKGFSVLAPGTDQMTWAGLAKKSYIEKLVGEKFDVVIDFSMEPTYFASSVLLNLPGAVRIGRGNYLGEPYYNLEIKTKYLRDQRAIYRSILDTLKSIQTGDFRRGPGHKNGLRTQEESCT